VNELCSIRRFAAKWKGTRWLHHEGIWPSVPSALGGVGTDDLSLVAPRSYCYPRCVTHGTIPNVRITLLISLDNCQRVVQSRPIGKLPTPTHIAAGDPEFGKLRSSLS